MGKATGIGAILATCLAASGSSAAVPISGEQLVTAEEVLSDNSFERMGFQKDPTGLVWERKQGAQRILLLAGTTQIQKIEIGSLHCYFELPDGLKLSLTGVDDIFASLEKVQPPVNDFKITLRAEKGQVINVTCRKPR